MGMGSELYQSLPTARDVFDQADEVLGFSISQLCFKGPEEELKKTLNCQPAILTLSIALWEVMRSGLQDLKSQVSYVAGLSLGEYSALVASRVLGFKDALQLVMIRAQLMEESAAKGSGKMAAIIGLDNAAVKKVCAPQAGVQIANLNCPGQVVISGEKEAVDRAKGLLLQEGAKKAVDLQVNGAFHSRLMEPAAERFKKVLEQVKFNPAQIPLVSNVDGQPHSEPREIRENLQRQICSSVLWEDSMRFIIAKNINRFYEIGPGKVLKGLMRKIDANINVVNIENKEDIERLGG